MATSKVCKIVSGLLQYFVLSAFFWMLLEGVLLYRMVILVFETKRTRLPLIYALAYGLPFFIVILSSSVHPDEMIRENFCWPSKKKGQIWSVVAPIFVVISVNFIIFCMAMKAASKIDKMGIKNSVKEKKNNTVKRLKGMVSLMCLLGMTWLVGFFQVPSQRLAAYLFVILNGLQGVFLFLTQILLNDNVRKKLFSIYKENLARISSAKSSWNLVIIPPQRSIKEDNSSSSKGPNFSDIYPPISELGPKVEPTAPNISDNELVRMNISDVEIIRIRSGQVGKAEDVRTRHPFEINYEKF